MNISDFGDFLKKQRAFKGLTVRGLSEQAGISPSYVTNLENAKRGVPSPEVLKRLADPLGVSFQELMVKAGHVVYEDWFYNREEDQSLDQYDNLFYPEMLGFPSREAYLMVVIEDMAELTHSLARIASPCPKYNGHPLTNQDRQRVLDMLKTLFPEYQQPPDAQNRPTENESNT